MKGYEGKIAGLMGTIIIHIIAGIIFMSVKLSSLYKEDQAEFLIEFQPEQAFVEDEVVEVPVSLEELFEGDERYTDIIKNIASQEEIEIDREEYINRVKEEMIAEGKLGEDNYIDRNSELLENMDEGDTAFESEQQDSLDLSEKLSANELAANYKGPTRVWYNLPGRHHLSLPIPIYKCENGGIVVIDISVVPGGEISSFSYNETESSTNDKCLYEAAVDAIRRTRFNPDPSAPAKQKGSITFQFVAQ
ncbi:MAG: energy transducer TonB [Bacteroidales bacterium]|nr:energy transducer TonB [Bacteroidales bacterium]